MIKDIAIGYNKSDFFMTIYSDWQWNLINQHCGFFIKYGSEEILVTCSIIKYVESTSESFVSMVCKNGKLPIKMTSFRSASDKFVKEINKGIQELLEVPKELLLEFILNGNFKTSELLKMLEFDKRFRTYDYALPQTWLDDFAEFMKEHDERVTYNLICSTTVWCYGGEASEWGKGVSVCAEINRAIELYTSYRANNRNYV